MKSSDKGALMAANWQIGERIQDRWEIHRILQGGMGVVYVVYDHRDREALAAKTFQDKAVDRDSDSAQRFLREAHTWINLDAHENVTRAKSARVIDGKPLLFLEYVAGGDLGEWIGTARLTENLPQVLRYAIQFCDGMSHALSKGIRAHRDIKPSNCLLTVDERLKVTDFGLAKAVYDGAAWPSEQPASEPAKAPERSSSIDGFPNGIATQTGIAGGTPHYMAPEQFEDFKRVDVRGDIYSFGVMLYQMTVGRLPYVGRNFEDFRRLHQTQMPPRFSKGPQQLEDLLQICLAKEPTERFADFSVIRHQLAEIYRRLTGQDAPQTVTAAELDHHDLANKARSLGDLGLHEEALAFYDQALQGESRRAHIWYNKGNSLQWLERWEEALACYGRALDINSSDSHAWSNRGMTLRSLGRIDEALASYDRALGIDPSDSTAWIGKAINLTDLGRHEEALPCYDNALAAIASDPHNKQNRVPRRQGRLLGMNAHAADILCGKADSLTKLQRYAEAIASCDRALESEPRCARAWSAKGWTLSLRIREGQEGQVEDALSCFDRALEIDPSDDATWGLKGASCLFVGRLDDALTCLKQAQRLGKPGRESTFEGLRKAIADAWLRKAARLVEEERHEEAIEFYDRALEVEPNHATGWYEKGTNLASLGRHTDAVLCYDRALEIDCGNASAWLNKGASLWSLGSSEDALACYERALEIDPRHVSAWLNKANRLRELGRAEEALACYDRALEIDPRFAGGWFNKGGTLVGLGRLRDAATCFDRALEIDPLMGSAWFNKAIVFRHLEQYEDALDCYDKAVQIDAENSDAWFAKGYTLIQLRRLEAALPCLEQALSLGHPRAKEAIETIQPLLDDLSSAEDWLCMGDAYVGQGRHEEAVLCYDRALAIDPQSARAWCNKGASLWHLGRQADALECYDQATKAEPLLALAWFNKGNRLLELDRYEDAFTCYEEALQIDPRLVPAWANKGAALESQDRHAEALICFDRALEIDPSWAALWFHKSITLRKLGQSGDALNCLQEADRLGLPQAKAMIDDMRRVATS